MAKIAALGAHRQGEQERGTDEQEHAQHQGQDDGCGKHPPQRGNARRRRQRVGRREVVGSQLPEHACLSAGAVVGEQHVAGRGRVEIAVQRERHRGPAAGGVRRHHDPDHSGAARRRGRARERHGVADADAQAVGDLGAEPDLGTVTR